MSKGSNRRPCKIDSKQFENNWDRIFNNNKNKKDNGNRSQ